MGSLRKRIQANPALKSSMEDLMFQVDFTTLDKKISIGIIPSRNAAAPPGRERLAVIYAKVKSGSVEITSLGNVTGWDALQTSAQIGNMFNLPSL